MYAGSIVTVSFNPPLSYSRSIFFPLFIFTPTEISLFVNTLLPFTLVILSPGINPAEAAGVPASILSKLVVANPKILNIVLKITIAKTKFMKAPAKIIEILLSGDLAEKLLSSSTASSSPNI